MNDIVAYKFMKEVKTFMKEIAPTDKQGGYLADTKGKISIELRQAAKESGHSIERCLLTAICGEFTTKKQQAEFATRLILLDLLTE